jgi:hypothetical protein
MWDPKGREKGGEKKEKERKREEIPKVFLPQLPAALSRSVATEATAQLLQRLLLTPLCRIILLLAPTPILGSESPSMKHRVAGWDFKYYLCF